MNTTGNPTRRTKKPNLQKLEKTCDRWNAGNPIGTPVTRYVLVNPLSMPIKTVTRSEAWVMGGHSVMVMVKGTGGGVLLESVIPIK